MSFEVIGRLAERLRRQVKVKLNMFPGHESGVGSSPTPVISFIFWQLRHAELRRANMFEGLFCRCMMNCLEDCAWKARSLRESNQAFI